MINFMRLFNRKKDNDSENTKCKECGLELYTPVRLERHKKKVHGNAPKKKFDPQSGEGGLW